MKKLNNSTKLAITGNLDLGKKITESILYEGEESTILFEAICGENKAAKGAITSFSIKNQVIAIISILVQNKVGNKTYTQPILLEGYEIEPKDITEAKFHECFNTIINENQHKMVSVLEDLR